MKPSKLSIPSRISCLLKSGAIFTPSFESYQSPNYHLEAYEPLEMAESSLVGKIVGGVVVSKNETAKQLCLHLTSYYDHSKKVQISANRYIAFIKDYELKADLSIFGYLNNFKDVELGTFINAWVRRAEKRQNNKTYFQLHLNRPPDSKIPIIKLGVVKDNVRIPDSVLKVYKKEEMLPLNFLTLYETDYDNPGLERSFQKELGVGSSGSIHSMSNLAAMKMLDYDYHRIRRIQQRSWRDEHLDLGLQCMKDAKYPAAIECFNLSLKFDPDFTDARIAKACAHVNMNNLGEGLKQIKEVLKLEPYNERAQRYHQQFQRQLPSKADEQSIISKKPGRNGYKMVFQK